MGELWAEENIAPPVPTAARLVRQCCQGYKVLTPPRKSASVLPEASKGLDYFAPMPFWLWRPWRLGGSSIFGLKLASPKPKYPARPLDRQRR